MYQLGRETNTVEVKGCAHTRTLTPVYVTEVRWHPCRGLHANDHIPRWLTRGSLSSWALTVMHLLAIRLDLQSTCCGTGSNACGTSTGGWKRGSDSSDPDCGTWGRTELGLTHYVTRAYGGDDHDSYCRRRDCDSIHWTMYTWLLCDHYPAVAWPLSA